MEALPSVLDLTKVRYKEHLGCGAPVLLWLRLGLRPALLRSAGSGSALSTAPELRRSMASFVVFEDPVLAPGDGHAAALQQKAGKPAAGADKENMDPARREREREAHEHSIARGELRCTASEQLDRWIEYLKWAQRSGLPKQDVLGLLERCTKTFKADKALRSQRKYLRVWINYADVLRQGGRV